MKLKLLDAKTVVQVQRIEMDLMLEQFVEEETDRMNNYLKEYCMHNQLKKELSSRPDELLTVTPNSEAQPANDHDSGKRGCQQLAVQSVSLCCHQLRSL